MYIIMNVMATSFYFLNGTLESRRAGYRDLRGLTCFFNHVPGHVDGQ
jgi:hypothetical protein